MISAPAVRLRALAAPSASDLYLTLTPDGPGDCAGQARDLYAAARGALVSAGGRLFSERIFASPEAMPDVLAARAALGELDDAVRPTRVLVAPGHTGLLAGIQIHAVRSDAAPVPVGCWGKADSPDACFARDLRIGGDRWLALSEVSPGGEVPPGRQAQRMFHCAGCFLRQCGTDMHAVARTWLWLLDVCDWYADLNAARNAFFRREGLIADGNGRPRLPASTGIGLGIANGAACGLDLIALPGRAGRIELLEAGGQQNSAYAYGSAFSRAAVVPMPGGRTLMVSGTAAIDRAGRTECVGDIDGQIDATIRHVRALLADAGCDDADVLTALVYCRTPEVERAFLARGGNPGWPAITMVGDVCRPDLLFEVELAAGPVPAREARP
ncbi:MAG: hypothetical protein BIFFINMI_01446 [Phycisphaerae bacterium]|nr:hypothetical protein [Phycisphaerae bacterium]